MIGIFTYIAACVLFGCISCFFGKKVYFPILMLTVFGSVIAAAFALFEMTWKVGIIAVLIGSVAAALSVFLYKFGVFLLGGALVAGVGLLLTFFLPAAVEKYGWIFVLILAIGLGVCALKWCELFIMASTAYNGASLITAPLLFLILQFRNLQSFVYADGIFSTMGNLNKYLNGEFAAQYSTQLLIGAIVLAVVGFVTQYISNRKGEYA